MPSTHFELSHSWNGPHNPSSSQADEGKFYSRQEGFRGHGPSKPLLGPLTTAPLPPGQGNCPFLQSRPPLMHTQSNEAHTHTQLQCMMLVIECLPQEQATDLKGTGQCYSMHCPVSLRLYERLTGDVSGGRTDDCVKTLTNKCLKTNVQDRGGSKKCSDSLCCRATRICYNLRLQC